VDSEDGVVKNLTEILDRLKKALDLTTDTSLASDMGIPLRRLQSWKYRGSVPCKELIDFCIKKGLDLNYILSDRPIPLLAPNGILLPLIPIDDTEESCCPTTNCVRPPRGYIKNLNLTSNQIIDTIHFDKDWVKHVLNATPKDIAAIRIVGNNMTPWISDGDIVLIDLSLTTIVTDAPYILQYEDVLVAKRLVRQNDGMITAKSDSLYCEDEFFQADTLPRIVGRIIRRVVR